MSRPAPRHLLAALSTLVLLAGLAPPPAMAAPPAGPALPAATQPDPADRPASGLLDVYAGFGDQPAATRPAPAASGSTADPAGVAGEVRAAVDEDGSAPVILRLREQADLERVADEATRAAQTAAANATRALPASADAERVARQAASAARTRTVVDSLQATAAGSQDTVRALLDDHQATRVREFWVFNGFAATVDAAALDALAGHPDVASVTLDDTITLEEPVPAQTGEPLLPAWSLERVRAPQTWGEYGVRGADVVVGVMDSGVDGGHPALAQAWRGTTGDPDASWFVPTGENYPQPGDGHGHGTHVTGSIVGAPPGEVTGVAPDAQWIAAKIFRDSGATSDSIIHAGFEWMLAPGGDPAAAPDVVNNSWGSDASNDAEFWDDVAAWQAAGVVPVFSNGNAGPGTGTVGSPASFPHAIGVGATDEQDRIAWFSSRGPVTWDGVEYTKPQVSAPGYQVRSTWPTGAPEGDYHTISGTSMAAPHVTGVVALMLSAAPDLTVEAVRQTLQGTARGESHMTALPDAYGAGVVDAHAAVTRVAHTGLVTGTVTGGDGEPLQVTVAAAGERTTTGEDGRYALRLPAGTHELTIGGYGYTTLTREVTVTVGGSVTADAALAVAPERTLSGTVRGADGPLGNARVSLPGTPVPATRADTGGRFQLTVAEGSYDLRARAGGYQPAGIAVTVSGDTEITVDLDPVAGPAPGWAQYQNNPARTGLSLDDLAGETLEPAWTAQAGGEVLFSSPVIAGGRVFVNTDAGQLAAFDLTTGAPLWTFDGGEGMRGAPAVAGGIVYTGGGVAGGIHAVDAATGEPVWTVETPGRRTIYTAPVVRDGVVYATTGFTPDRPDTAFALAADTGEVHWSADIGPNVFFGPAVADGLVVAGTAGDRRLVALDADTGAQVWSLPRADDEFIAAPSIADGTVYATTSVPPVGTGPGFQGSLLAVDAATGQLRWEAPAHGDGQGTAPAVYGDLVIAGSHGLGVVGAYDRATGEPAWHYGLETSGGVSASVMVSGDGYVVGGSQLDERVFVLDAATGEQVWEQPVDAGILSSPAYADGRLVVADRTGTLRAFHPTGQLSGTVTGPDGPLPATVRVVEADREATADPDTGAYEVTGLPPGEYTVEVSHYGFGTQTRTVTVAVARATGLDVELAPVGHGTVAGVVRDQAGQPLPGATVTLSPSPLDPVVTGEDGSYRFDEVPAGAYRLRAEAAGYATVEPEVTVTAGQTTTVEVALERFDVAVVADHQGRVAAVLEDAGWRVDRVSFGEIAGTVDRYRAVVLAGMTGDRADADPDRFAQLVADADEAGTSLVFLDTGGPSYGSIRTLSQVTGDPAAEDAELSNRGAVWLEDVVEHPVTASLPAGARVPLLASGSWHAWFSDYSGYSLATLGNDRDGQRGTGIGYQRRTLDSNHILLSAAAPSPWSTWEPAVAQLLAGAVAHAADAAYGAVAGQVTDESGNPVPAEVEVAGGFESTVAGADGDYRLLLEPGQTTLRFRFLGSQPVELPVTVTAGQTVTLDVPLPDAQLGTVAGRVTDASRDTPVAGAQVALAGGPSATTGGDGRYVIEGVPGGSYQVEIAADGYDPHTAGIEVTDGEVTTLDAALTRAPGVVVLGDRDGELVAFLEQHSVPAQEAGWEVVDALDGVEVAVVNNPDELAQAEFLAALAAFDEAGVSVIFTADGWSFRTSGFDMLVEHTGDPPEYDRLGGFSGPEIFLHNLADHPLFDGVTGDPVQLLTASSEAAHFPSYSGITLADVAEAGADPAGIGMAYDARTPDSVHLLLSGLAATFRNSPTGSWTPDGQRIFLNAVRWAADPGMGGLAGTVTDAGGEPVAGARVEVTGTSWGAVSDENGAFEIGVPPGEYTLTYQAFGYVAAERTLTVGADHTVDASVELGVGDVGSITGVVTSQPDGGVEPAQVEGPPLEGVQVRLRGTPYRTVTEADGTYRFARVEPGSYDLELETGGHVRTLAPVEVSAGQETARDVALRTSPLVGIIDDSDFSNSRDRGKEFLADWGYRAEDIGFDSLDRIGALDLVIANVSDFGLEVSAAQLQAFEEAVNRAGVPVLWMGQDGRGAIQFLHEYYGDPAVVGEGSRDGPVTAQVVADHPLVAGLPDEFALLEPDSRYSFFDEFGGTTVASLATGDGGEVGDTIAFRGRTAATVDVLLSTMSITTWGAPSTRQSPAVDWTPQAERVLVNALAWALDAQGIGAEVRGVVDSDRGGRIPSRVEVVETGRTYQGRAGDGSFLVPLPPGTWTLQVSSFGHASQTVEVTVQAGDARIQPVTLAALPAGAVAGTVTGPDGSPVPGAQVSLVGTPLSATTGGGGGYTIDQVPAGDWTLRVVADGFRAAEVPVTVTAGQTLPAGVQLLASAAVALVDTTGSSSDGTALAGLLAGEGYQVELVDRDELAALAGRMDEFDLVIFNSSLLSSHQAAFGQALDAAEAAGVSTIVPGQFGGYALGELSELRGDPEQVDWGFVPDGVDYVPAAPHPIFAGFPVGEPIELISDPGTNQQWASYAGYSGQTIANVHARGDGQDLGEAVGYRFTTPTSVELLLGGLASATYGSPGEEWTPQAERIYLNAVGWSIDATQAELAGTVTGGGGPLAGATVTAVEAAATAVTGPDGSYSLGLPAGTHTVRVAAFGYETAERVAEVPASGTVTLDVDLAPLPRGEVSGTIMSTGGEPVAGATVTGTGPLEWTATTGDGGGYAAGDLLEGTYEVAVTAAGFLPAGGTVTVSAGDPATLDLTLQPTDVGVLGDVEDALTTYLRGEGVPAAELDWSADLDLSRYRVVVVNGGAPDAATFDAVLAAADEAGVSLVFTGTWAADRGGIRLLERYTDRVTVAAQGYGDGPVQLTGFDPEHPVFAGLGGDPATLIVEGGYYSTLESYAGRPLADLRVPRDGADPVTGLAAGWDWRTAGSVEVVLSASAVTEAVGPGLGWTPEGGRLLVDAISWARDRVLAPPAVPTLAAEAPVVVGETVTVTGESPWPSQVTVLRDGDPVATVDPGLDGTWSAQVPLSVGDNELTAVATNLAGQSPAAAPVTVARWVPDWQVRGHWPVHVVTLALDGPSRWSDPAGKAHLVVRDADGDEVLRTDLHWILGFYLDVLLGLRPGDYTLSAELMVDGHLLVIDGPALE